MKFTHLHCHSHYSLLDGLSRIGPLVERTKNLGMEALALTDHGVLYGAVEFYNKARDAGLKPIIGMEVYIAPRGLASKDGRQDADYYHLTLLAMNDQGYKNLIQLTTIAHLEGFYYKPRIDKEILKKYGDGLIALSGCQRGEIPRAVVNQSDQEAKLALRQHLNIFGPNRLYVEIQRNARANTEAQTALNNALIAFARTNGLPLVATQDSHYIYPEDAEAHDVMVCIGTGKTVGDSGRLDMRGADLSLRSPEQMAEAFYDLPEAISNTQVIAEQCNLEILVDQRYFPTVELPKGVTAEEHLKTLAHQRARELYAKDEAVPQEITERIDYELNIINKKGFATYFLMVADIVGGAHELGALTNTRGSAAGSLVGKVLGITTVDPIYYELPFERFLTMDRPGTPDIDLDIADNRREETIGWITERYGRDKVAQIITFGTMKARAAVRDVGRALGVPYGKCDRIAKMIPLGKQGFDMTLDHAITVTPELKDVYERDPETNKILTIAKKLEGCARHASIHAAGIVITPTALTDYLPLQLEPDGQRRITQYDMYAIDVNVNSKALGLIKIDLLGIRNLTIVEQAVRIVKQRHGIDIDIYNLPHPDEKTFKLLSDGLTFGVFQLGSSGITRYLRELRPTRIFDIMAMIALYRPGPMQFIPEYIARKHNPSLIKYFDPALEKILKRTYGILVYQDDLLTIAHDLAGYSWAEVDKFRKAVGKKDPVEMAKQKIKFIQGCMDTSGWSHNKASQIWAWIEPFAAYGFNKAHSASYAIVSYQTAYMKANYPVEFMAALMTAESGDETKIYAAVEEGKNLSIQVLPPDVNESLDNFTVVNEATIRFGLNAIKNLGNDVIARIIEVRNNLVGDPGTQAQSRGFASLEDFLIRSHTKNLNKKSWEALVKSGALDSFGERGSMLASTEQVLDFLREHFKHETSGQNSLFGTSNQTGRLKLKNVAPADKDERLAWEKEHLGMYVSAHPLDRYREVLKSVTSIKTLADLGEDNIVTVGGIIAKLKRTITKKNDPMAFLTLQDSSGIIEVLVFPKVMANVVSLLQLDGVVQVSGRLSEREGEFNLIANDLRSLPTDESYLAALSEMEKNKQVVIHMQKSSDPEVLNRIKDVIVSFPGQAQVYLNLGNGTGAKMIKTHSQVRISNDLVAALKAIPEVLMVSEK